MHHLPATMRALELQMYDGLAESLRVVERPRPIPGRNEVLVKIAAAPINPSDLLFLRGQYGLRKTLPVVPGLECSGTIVDTGGELRARTMLGRRVACGSPDDRDGTWAEYMTVPVEYCLPLLPHISTLQGASMIVNPFTAWALVEQARRGGHRAAVQTTASSSLGRMIMRLAQRFHLPMIHIVRRADHVEALKAMGARYVLNSRKPDFDVQLRELCHRLGATFAMDAVAGEMTGRLLRAMPDGSTVAVYGLLSGEPCQIDVDELVFHARQVRGFWLTDWLIPRGQASVLLAGIRIQRLFASDFKTSVRACLPLEDAPFGIDLYEQHMSEGKVLLLPELRRSVSPVRG